MHHELPERLDVAWYRARARELQRSIQANNAESRQRVEEAIGRRPTFGRISRRVTRSTTARRSAGPRAARAAHRLNRICAPSRTMQVEDDHGAG